MRQAPPTSSRACFALLLFFVLRCATAHAQADNGPVLLINADAELIRAAQTAFTVANALSIANDSMLADPTTPEAAQLARVRTLAQDTNARMVVWTRPGPAGSELQVFESSAGALVATRQLPKVLDPAGAAAVVLSIKTWLQQPVATAVDEAATAVERVERPTAPLAQRAPPTTPGPEERAPAPSSHAAEQVTQSGAQSQRQGESRLELGLGAAVARLQRAARVRFELGAAWWPARGFVGIELRAQAGPAFTLEASVGRTRVLDGALALAVAARTRVSGRLWLAGGIGPSLHLVRLWGTLDPVKNVPVDVTRFVPGLGGGARASYWLAPSISVGLWVYCGWLLRVQRYYVDGTQVLQPERLRAESGVALGLALD